MRTSNGLKKLYLIAWYGGSEDPAFAVRESKEQAEEVKAEWMHDWDPEMDAIVIHTIDLENMIVN